MNMGPEKRRLSAEADAQHLEALRLTSPEDSWRLEIEYILNGVRDSIIEHRGDAGVYVEDLIEQAIDPAISRVAFQNAVERQTAQWKPPRGVAPLLELLRRFTPRAGFPRLIEMFRLPGGFPGDPPLEEPEFEGRDLRLNALHALERYFPASPINAEAVTDPSSIPTQEAFATYLTILGEHLRFPRYEEYARVTLEGLLATTRSSPLQITRLVRETPTPLKEHGVRIDRPTDAVQELQDEPEHSSSPTRGSSQVGQSVNASTTEAILEPGVLALVYEAALLQGQDAEREFREHVESLGFDISYELRGPSVRQLRDLESVSIAITVRPDLFDTYFEIYLAQNPLEVDALVGSYS